MYPSLTSLPKLIIFRAFLIGSMLVLSQPMLVGQEVPSRGLSYFEGSFADMQRLASSVQKPYILYFYTSWAPTCQEMESHTFNYAPLQQYLAANYLVYRVNAEASRGEGPVLAEAYNVQFYPTVIVCGPDEKLLGRFSGAKEPESLLEELINYHNQTLYGASQAEFTPKPAVAYEPVDQSNGSWDAEPAPAGPPIEPVDSYRPPAPVNSSSDAWSGDPLPPTDALDLPSIEAYGVQVGAYSVETNARAVQTRLRNEMRREILVRETRVDGRILYKVIIGPFWERVDARQYQNVFREATGKECIIIEYQP